jgi:hypothetical protein
MSKHKASLNNGSQKHHSDAKYYGKFDQSWWCTWCHFFLWSWCSPLIFNSWMEKKWTFHLKNAPTKFFPTNYSRLCCKAWQHTGPTTPVLTLSPTNRVILFPKVEIHTERPTLERDDNIKENSLAKLCNIPQKAFQQCPQMSRKCWKQCIRSAWKYFAGDKAE